MTCMNVNVTAVVALLSAPFSSTPTRLRSPSSPGRESDLSRCSGVEQGRCWKGSDPAGLGCHPSTPRLDMRMPAPSPSQGQGAAKQSKYRRVKIMPALHLPAQPATITGQHSHRGKEPTFVLPSPPSPSSSGTFDANESSCHLTRGALGYLAFPSDP